MGYQSVRAEVMMTAEGSLQNNLFNRHCKRSFLFVIRITDTWGSDPVPQIAPPVSVLSQLFLT